MAVKSRQRGMTLIEIMVVITILGMIATVVAVSVVQHLKDAKVKIARIETHHLASAIKLYYAKTGSLPAPGKGLKVLETSHVIDRLGDDPWGHPCVMLEEDGEASVVSYGADGAPGGTDDAADISSNDPRSPRG